MKLVVCGKCGDWVRLEQKPRNCACGRSGGMYRLDALHAVVWGRAIPVAVSNPEYDAAMRQVDITKEPRPVGQWWLLGGEGGNVKKFDTYEEARRDV